MRGNLFRCVNAYLALLGKIYETKLEKLKKLTFAFSFWGWKYIFYFEVFLLAGDCLYKHHFVEWVNCNHRIIVLRMKTNGSRQCTIIYFIVLTFLALLDKIHKIRESLFIFALFWWQETGCLNVYKLHFVEWGNCNQWIKFWEWKRMTWIDAW